MAFYLPELVNTSHFFVKTFGQINFYLQICLSNEGISLLCSGRCPSWNLISCYLNIRNFDKINDSH